MKLSFSILSKWARKPYNLYGRILLWAETQQDKGSIQVSDLDHRGRLLLSKLRPVIVTSPRVVFDIGASVGDFTAVFSACEAVERVVAFEPLPGSFAILKERSAKSGKVHCIRIALGATNSETTMYESSFRDSSSILPMTDLHKQAFPQTSGHTCLTVHVRRLDDLVTELNLPQPDLIKIDVQGFESQVIEGGQQTLSNARTILIEVSFVELYEGSPLFEAIYDTMKSFGFRLTGIFGTSTTPEGKVLQADAIFSRE